MLKVWKVKFRVPAGLELTFLLSGCGQYLSAHSLFVVPTVEKEGLLVSPLFYRDIGSMGVGAYPSDLI